MSSNIVINELYETFSFIEEDKAKFSDIAFKNIPKKSNKENTIEKAKKNIAKYIVSVIIDNGFADIFNKAVNKMGIENAFDFFDMIIQSANLEISIEEIMSISYNKKYKDFYDKLISDNKEIKNILLNDILDTLKEAEDETDDKLLESVVTDDPIHDYFKEIGKITVLTREEEQALIKKYRETNDKAYKDEFIEHNLRLAAKEAVIYKRNHPEVKIELLDLIQEGNMGLIRAFETFDETLGYKFSTYATGWINQKISRYVRNTNDTIRIPVHVGEAITKKNRFIIDYRNKYNEPPTDEEIIEYMKMTEEQYDNLLKAEKIKSPASIDINIETEETRKGRETTFSSFLADETTSHVADEAINSYFGDQMIEFAREVLTEKEFKIILDRCGYNKYKEPLTLEEIGKKYGVTRERIRQIENKAEKKLQRKNYMLGEVEEKKSNEIRTKDDLLRILMEKNMNISIIQYRKESLNSVFRCKKCNEKFTEEPKKLIDRGTCPYCEEKSKQFFKILNN